MIGRRATLLLLVLLGCLTFVQAKPKSLQQAQKDFATLVSQLQSDPQLSPFTFASSPSEKLYFKIQKKFTKVALSLKTNAALVDVQVTPSVLTGDFKTGQPFDSKQTFEYVRNNNVAMAIMARKCGKKAEQRKLYLGSSQGFQNMTLSIGGISLFSPGSEDFRGYSPKNDAYDALTGSKLKTCNKRRNSDPGVPILHQVFKDHANPGKGCTVKVLFFYERTFDNCFEWEVRSLFTKDPQASPFALSGPNEGRAVYDDETWISFILGSLPAKRTIKVDGPAASDCTVKLEFPPNVYGQTTAADHCVPATLKEQKEKQEKAEEEERAKQAEKEAEKEGPKKNQQNQNGGQNGGNNQNGNQGPKQDQPQNQPNQNQQHQNSGSSSQPNQPNQQQPPSGSAFRSLSRKHH